MRIAATIVFLIAVVPTTAARAQTLAEPSARTWAPRHDASWCGDPASRPRSRPRPRNHSLLARRTFATVPTADPS